MAIGLKKAGPGNRPVAKRRKNGFGRRAGDRSKKEYTNLGTKATELGQTSERGDVGTVALGSQ